jgi:hypothetical protein
MLYQIVTGEIQKGDLCSPAGPLVPVPSELIGKDAKVFSYFPNGAQIPIFRPVKVPNLDETNDARLKLCRDDSICDASGCCSDCMYKTMLRLMGLEEVEG